MDERIEKLKAALGFGGYSLCVEVDHLVELFARIDRLQGYYDDALELAGVMMLERNEAQEALNTATAKIWRREDAPPCASCCAPLFPDEVNSDGYGHCDECCERMAGEIENFFEVGQ